MDQGIHGVQTRAISYGTSIQTREQFNIVELTTIQGSRAIASQMRAT